LRRRESDAETRRHGDAAVELVSSIGNERE
jgi:hypothetical protein